MSIRTLAELFLHTAGMNKPDCLLHKVDDQYRPISTADFAERVKRLSKSFADLGVKPGDRVALMSENGPHWPTVDFAIQCLGAVLVPIYPTLLPEQAAYIINDCGAKIAVAETEAHLTGMLDHAAELPQVERLILIKGTPSDSKVVTLESLINAGAGYDAAAFEAKAKAVEPSALATFIYTSGTTGQPKGVMLTHDNIVSNLLAAHRAFPIPGTYVALSFLPLSHSFERTVDYFYFYKGITIAYAESINALPKNLQEVRPHLFVAVPRVYEKLLSRVNEAVAAGSPLRQKLFHWAVDVGRRSVPYRLKQQKPSGLLGLQLALRAGRENLRTGTDTRTGNEETRECRGRVAERCPSGRRRDSGLRHCRGWFLEARCR